MAGIIAFCKNTQCNSIFEFKNLIGGDGKVQINMTGCSVGPCPNCSSQGIVPDGVYEYADHAITLVKGTLNSIELLTRIEQIVRKSVEENKTKEEIVQAVETEVPEAKSFLDSIPVIDNLAQWVSILISILTFAILIHTTYIENEDDDKYKEMFIDHLLKENQELKKPKPIEAKKIPRNDPCPCGSGKKYKKCCYLT
jgi:hypothetical protein